MPRQRRTKLSRGAGALFAGVLFQVLLILSWATAQPVSLDNKFILNSFHYGMRPTAASIVPDGVWQVEFGGSLTNSFVTNDQYVVDLEQRDVRLSIARALNQESEFSVTIPVHWRGGGTLDHLIRNWHTWFGLPEGDRESVEDDQFLVAGSTDQGSFGITERGFGLGNASVRFKHRLIEINHETMVSGATTIALPTAQSGFGQDGVDVSLELLAQGGIGSGQWFGGVAGLWYSDTFEQGLEYRSVQGEGFLQVSYPLIESLSLLVGVYGGSQSLANISTIPDGFLYLDTGLSFRLSESERCSFIVRENPYPSRTSANVTFDFSCGMTL